MIGITDHPEWGRYERLLKIAELWEEVARVGLVRRYALKRFFRAAGAAARLHGRMGREVLEMRRLEREARDSTRDEVFAALDFAFGASAITFAEEYLADVVGVSEAVARRLGWSPESVRPHVRAYFEELSS